MTVKANPAANIHGDPVLVPAGSHFHDGSPFNWTSGGIVHTPDGRVLSVAEPGSVPDIGFDGPAYIPFKGHLIPGNRVAELRIVTANTACMVQPGYGFEWELPVIDAETGDIKRVNDNALDGKVHFRGNLGQLSSKYANIMPEAHNYVVEVGVNPADTIDELSHNMILGVSDVVEAIVADGGLPLATDVVGNRKLGLSERSREPYLSSTVEWLARHGQFTKAFPIYTFLSAWSAQFHRDIRSTEAAVRAAGYMQSANVVLAAVGLNGPFFMGRYNVENIPMFTAKQWGVLAGRGLSQQDFTGTRLSWRGTLMNVVSPSAGTWRELPPHELDAYLSYCHRKLCDGRASSSDRSAANHGDRLRLTIGRTGTFENLSQSNIPSLHSQISALVVWNAIFTSVEEMILNGVNPCDVAPFLFGASLDQARRERMLVDRLGADVLRRGRPLYTAKDEVLRVAAYSKQNRLPRFYVDWHLRAYASGAQTLRAIREWCAETGNPPGMQAFHEIGVGAPAYYALARYHFLKSRYPVMPEAEIIRECYLDSGRALVSETRQARRRIERQPWRL